MRILLINKRAPFEGRGAEQVIWRIGHRFAEAGHRVLFFCPTPTQSNEIPSVDVEFEFVETSNDPTRGMIEFFLRGPIEYYQVYKKFDPDVVYDNPSPFPFHIAHLLGDAPVVNKVHAVYRSYAFECKDHPLVKIGTIIGESGYRLFRNEHFVTNSVSTATRLQSLVNTEKNDLVANPIGIDESEFQFKLPDSGKRVLTVSKLSPRKRVTDLLHAWELVETHHPEATLTIVGSGPQEGDLLAMADQLNLRNVIFKGFVSESKKRTLLSRSSIFASPTLYEGFGLSVLEAMASGCAVVASNTWGLKDFIEHGENGLLAPVKAPKEFGRQLSQLLGDASQRKQLASTAKKTAESYSMIASFDRELEYINSVVEESVNSSE